jgi:hypothetical protein
MGGGVRDCGTGEPGNRGTGEPGSRGTRELGSEGESGEILEGWMRGRVRSAGVLGLWCDGVTE